MDSKIIVSELKQRYPDKKIVQLNTLLSKAGFRVIVQEEHKSQDTESMSDTIIYTIAKKV